jgi:hypothetical protein
MDLSEYVLPQVELMVTTAGRAINIFMPNSARLMPREEATSDFARSLKSLATGEAFDGLVFCYVYFEMESILALQQTLDRLLEQHCTFNDVQFVNCKGEVEMAILLLLKSKCQQLSIGCQCLPFTPALAEALAKSDSLDTLVFSEVTFDRAEMDRLALCLNKNSSITTLRLADAFQEDEGDDSVVAFVKHLPGMSHLRHLTLGGNEVGEAGERALVEVLEEGVHPLSELKLEGKPPCSLQYYINFLLWLKKFGGKRAISSCSRMKWIDLLSHITNDEDLSALYFTLRSDPSRFMNL